MMWEYSQIQSPALSLTDHRLNCLYRRSSLSSPNAVWKGVCEAKQLLQMCNKWRGNRPGFCGCVWGACCFSYICFFRELRAEGSTNIYKRWCHQLVCIFGSLSSNSNQKKYQVTETWLVLCFTSPWQDTFIICSSASWLSKGRLLLSTTWSRKVQNTLASEMRMELAHCTMPQPEETWT